jgi:hypothetical protein
MFIFPFNLHTPPSFFFRSMHCYYFLLLLYPSLISCFLTLTILFTSTISQQATQSGISAVIINRPSQPTGLDPLRRTTTSRDFWMASNASNLPIPTPDPKFTAFTKWHDNFFPSSNSLAWVACLLLEGPSFLPPFTHGVLSVASYCYFCTCL